MLSSPRLQTTISPGFSSSLVSFVYSLETTLLLITPLTPSLEQSPEPAMRSNLQGLVPGVVSYHANINKPNLQIEYDDYEDKSMYTN